MPSRPPDWHTAQVRTWLAAQPGTTEWISGYASTDLRVLALRLCVSNTSWELLGVNFALVDWSGLATELGCPDVPTPPKKDDSKTS